LVAERKDLNRILIDMYLAKAIEEAKQYGKFKD